MAKERIYKVGRFAVSFRNPTIETHFWLGEDDRTAEDMERTRKTQEAMETEEYFVSANVRDSAPYKRLAMLDKCEKGRGRAYGYADRDFIEFRGMNAWNDDEPTYPDAQELTPEERAEYRAVCETELARFKKRLRTYLKRYGLEHVHCSTYWSMR